VISTAERQGSLQEQPLKILDTECSQHGSEQSPTVCLPCTGCSLACCDGSKLMHVATKNYVHASKGLRQSPSIARAFGYGDVAGTLGKK